jgi:hypothetical protein
MYVAFGKGARREFAIIVALAAAGIVLASLVAFTPWYDGLSTVSFTTLAEQAVAGAGVLLR